jgi:hypothetical protein
MTYPKTLAGTFAALQEYEPNVAEASAEYSDALAVAAKVPRLVACFDALSPHFATLDAAGLACLAGCSAQISRGGFFGKTDEALAVFAAVYPLLPAPVAPAE